MNEDNPDVVVIRQVLAGDPDAFRGLVVRYKDLVFALIMRQVADHAVAEDLSQEVFMKAFTALRRFRGDAQFSTWLTRIALNATNSYFSSRRYRERRRSEPFEPVRHDRASAPAEAEDDGVSETMKEQFRNGLAALASHYRDVLVLVGLEGHSYEEAAETLGIPLGTVRSRLSKARELIRARIEQGY